jgi:uncharacterized protein
VEVQGAPLADLHVESDNAHGDLFVRLCDVDEKGRSMNVTDRIVRCGPGDTTPGQARAVRVTLDPTAYRFLAGHRIRLQVSGGAHPRFARNLGTGEDPATGTATRPVTHRIQHHAGGASRLTLPTVPTGTMEPPGTTGPAAPPEPVP